MTTNLVGSEQRRHLLCCHPEMDSRGEFFDGLPGCNSLKTLVGPPGFEPGTSCTPSKRASQAAPRPEFLQSNIAKRPEKKKQRWPHGRQRCVLYLSVVGLAELILLQIALGDDGAVEGSVLLLRAIRILDG